MARYRKKPVVIDAWQLPLRDAETRGWGDHPDIIFKRELIDGEMMIVEAVIITPEGTVTARGSDWIIRGVVGEFYPCKADIFAETYEVVEPCT